MIFRKTILSVLFVLITVVLNSSTINILFFNDFHGQVEATKKAPGMVKFVSFIDEFRKENPNTIVLAGGDNYQGPVISNLTRGAVVNKMFSLIGLAASAVGNHEFDWGVKYFPKWQENGNFTYLAANIVNKSDNKIPTWLKPYKIVNEGGKKIAIIGLTTTDTVNTTLKENIENLKFNNPEMALKQNLDTLSEKENLDICIVISHIPAHTNTQELKIEGIEINDLLKYKDKVTLFFTGHNHEIVQGKIDVEPVYQAGSNGNYLIDVAITFDDNTNKIVSIKDSVLDVMNSNPKTTNKEAEKIFSFYSNKMEKMSQKVVGRCSQDITDTEEKYHLTQIGATICKVINEMSDSQVTILNQWGFRSDFKKGKLTYGDLYRVLPFDNTVVTMKISGKKLKEQIEHSITLQGGDYYGVKVVYNSSKPEGQRIEKISLSDGKPVNDNEFYKLAVNNFMFTGGDKYNFDGTKDVVDTQMTLRGVVLKYIEKNKILSPVNTDYSQIK